MNNRPNSKETEQLFYDVLKKAGIKNKYDIGIFEVKGNFLGWLGLNIGVHPKYLRVNPNVGIHSIPVRQLLDEIDGKKYQRGRFPTFSMPIGNICPDDLQFIIEKNEDIKLEADRLLTLMTERVIPHLAIFANKEAMIDYLTKDRQYLTTLPAALFVYGRKQDSLDCINKDLLLHKDNPHQEYFVTRLEKLKKIIDESSLLKAE